MTYILFSSPENISRTSGQDAGVREGELSAVSKEISEGTGGSVQGENVRHPIIILH